MVQGVNQFALQNLQFGKKPQFGGQQRRKQEEYSAALAPQSAGFRAPQFSGIGQTQGVSPAALTGVSKGANPQFNVNRPAPSFGQGGKLDFSA